MKSFTKFCVADSDIVKVFHKAGFCEITSIEPLTAGEFNSAYFVIADKNEYVLKISPKDDTNVLTYEKDIMDKEIKFYNMIAEKTDIKIPKIYYSDFSKSIIPVNLFIMERLSGKPLTSIKLSSDDGADVIEKVGEMIAKLDNIDGENFGYIQNGLEISWYKAFRKMTLNLIDDCKSLNKTCKNGEKLIEYIDKNKKLLEEIKPKYCHFDIWEGNIFYEKVENEIILTLIDTERGFFGDNIGDFCSIDFFKPLEMKSNLINGYNKITKNPISFSNDEIIRYNLLLCYLGIIIYAEKFVRYKKTDKKYLFNVISSEIICKKALKALKNAKITNK
ncbi:MAG: aminoglycoside phosphotransferase family protein [Oscillospiraceae bacterium]